MRTLCGFGRRVQRLIGRDRSAAEPIRVAEIRPLAGGRRPLVSDRLGEQRRGGARLDQVDGTTCGSAVLVALAAWADPDETPRLDGELGPDGRRRHRRRAAGRGYRVRGRLRGPVRRPAAAGAPRVHPVLAAGARHLAVGDGGVAAPATPRRPGRTGCGWSTTRRRRTWPTPSRGPAAALAAGRPVPLLIGGFLPRHYVLALAAVEAGWRVYEPGSGQVWLVEPDLLRRRALGPVLGFDRWHAVLLPG